MKLPNNKGDIPMKDLFVITGAAGGMGRAAAFRFKEKGDLLLLDVSKNSLESFRDELGDGTEILPFDITKSEDIEKAAKIVSEHGSFKGLLHFAGVSESMSSASKIIEINLVGTKKLLDAFYPLAANGSVVVNISSMAAFLSPSSPEIIAELKKILEPGFSEKIAAMGKGNTTAAYGWSKLGVMNLTVDEAARWGEKGARIVSVAPGAILTPMVENEMKNNCDSINRLIAATPLKRIGLPEDIVNLCEFLCSEKASFITGTNILIDGGVTQIFKKSLSN